jgi:hypothetical protein
VPPGCSFYIKGDAPGASLVDLTKIDTPILALSKVIAGIDNVVAKVHADVISESFGLNSVPPTSFGNLLAQADEAAVEAGVTDLLDADMIWPDPTNSNTLQVQGPALQPPGCPHPGVLRRPLWKP